MRQTGWTLLVKKALDRTAAAVGLVVTAPVMAATAAAIALTLGRPVVFRQIRPGLGGKPFGKDFGFTDSSHPKSNPYRKQARLIAIAKRMSSTTSMWSIRVSSA